MFASAPAVLVAPVSVLTLSVLTVQIPAPPQEPETEAKAPEAGTADVVVEPLASATADSSPTGSKGKAAPALPELLQVCVPRLCATSESRVRSMHAV